MWDVYTAGFGGERLETDETEPHPSKPGARAGAAVETPETPAHRETGGSEPWTGASPAPAGALEALSWHSYCYRIGMSPRLAWLCSVYHRHVFSVQVGLYTILLFPILYAVGHTKGGSGGGLHCAIVVK